MNKYVNLLNNKQFKEALEYSEKQVYLQAYRYSGNNQSATARLLGVARGTVIAKLKGILG